MKKMVKKNQIILTVLAMMVAVAGYLNFSGQNMSVGTPDQKVKVGDSTKDTEDSLEIDEDVYEISDDAEESSAKGTKSKEKSKKEKKVASQDNPGEAVMVSNTIGADYFSSAKLSREQTRAKNKETLMEIINNDKLGDEDKKAAVKEVTKITKEASKETAAENMLEAKGFAGAMVSISDGKVDVVVDGTKLKNKEIAQIMDIVMRKTGVSADKIVVTPLSVKEK